METIDIWAQCFFGSTDSVSRRLCQYDGHYGTHECNLECPFYMTKRDAVNICKEYVANEIKAVDELIEEVEKQKGGVMDG